MSTFLINAEKEIKLADKIRSEFPEGHILPMVTLLNEFAQVIVNSIVLGIRALRAFALNDHFFKVFILLLKDFQYGIFHHANTQKHELYLLCGCKSLVFEHIFINLVDTPPYVIQLLVNTQSFGTLSLNSSVL